MEILYIISFPLLGYLRKNIFNFSDCSLCKILDQRTIHISQWCFMEIIIAIFITGPNHDEDNWRFT
jgi:hypothetical protein